MKRIFVIVLLCFLIMTLSASALVQEDNGDTFVIQKDEMVKSDVFAGAGYVKIHGNVNGDLFAASGEFQHDGHVTGDILLLAGNSDIGGIVDGDIRVGAGRVVIDGEVRRNITAFSGDVSLGEDARVYGSITALAGRIAINGFVGGDFRSGEAEEILINGVIKGDVQVGKSNFKFGPKAKVHGNFTYASENEKQIPEGVVEGEIIYKQYVKKVNVEEVEKGFKIFNIVKGAIFLLSYLIIGTLAVLIFKNFIKKTAITVEQNPWYTIGIGSVGLIVTPIAAILIMITVIGIPISIISLMLYGILVYLAKLPCALWIGTKILKDEKKPLLPILIGIFILRFVSYIPYIGFLVTLVVTTFGLGSYLINIKEELQKS